MKGVMCPKTRWTVRVFVRNRSCGQHGAAMSEASLSMLFFLVVLFLSFDIFQFISTKATLQLALQDTSRYVATGERMDSRIRFNSAWFYYREVAKNHGLYLTRDRPDTEEPGNSALDPFRVLVRILGKLLERLVKCGKLSNLFPDFLRGLCFGARHRNTSVRYG